MPAISLRKTMILRFLLPAIFVSHDRIVDEKKDGKKGNKPQLGLNKLWDKVGHSVCLIATHLLKKHMSLVQKVRNMISAHPRVTTTAAMFGIGLAITFVIGSVVGVFDHSHLANAIHQHNHSSQP